MYVISFFKPAVVIYSRVRTWETAKTGMSQDAG